MRARSIIATLGCAAIGACSAPQVGVDPPDDGVDAPADAPGAPTLTFEVWNPWLLDREPSLDARRPKVLEALAHDDADVICLPGVARDADKTAIVEAVKGALPHVAWFPTTAETVVPDTSGVHGIVPPPVTTPPCGVESSAALDAFLACLKSSCNDGTEHDVDNPMCPGTRCLSDLATLGDRDPRCAVCVGAALADETFTDARAQCTENVHGDLAFRGQNPLLLLSRHPLRDASMYVFPNTSRRTGIVRAVVEAGGRDVDVYCSTLELAVIPQYYAGPYSFTGVKNGVVENYIVLAKMIDRVRAGSATSPAVLLAAHYDPENVDKDIVPYGLASELRSNFAEGLIADWRKCTMCRDNALSRFPQDFQLAGIYLHHIPRSDVLATDRTHLEPVALVDGKSVPASFEYGIRSTIVVR